MGLADLVVTARATAYTWLRMAIPHELVAELLALSDEDRGALAALLLGSLEPEGGDEVVDAPWDTAWAAALERRAREVTEGHVALIDGDQVAAEVRAMLADRT